MHFDVHNGDLRLGRATLSAPGHHNVLNALAAIAVGLELDMTFDSIAVGIASYSGVQRRMEEIGEAGGILVVDDYAHHPTEVKATLDGAAGCWPDRRIIAVFQPHLYSRTQDLCDDFASSFFDADVVVIMDVYGAREAPVEGVSGELISKRAHLAGHPHVEYVPNKEELVEFVVRLSRPGDVVITLGAGDIWRLNRQILSRLQEAN